MQDDAFRKSAYIVKKLRNRVLDLLTDKEKRERRRIKVAEIANAIGVSPHTVTKWIKDDISQIDVHVLMGLCDYFGVRFDELLYEEETPDDA
jgi:transcriptional regulator with XRE-family HTH domain